MPDRQRPVEQDNEMEEGEPFALSSPSKGIAHI
jgi:hypothetical protein